LNIYIWQRKYLRKKQRQAKIFIMKLYFKIVFSIFIILFLFNPIKGNSIKMENKQIRLPLKVGMWERPGAPKIIDKTNIFDYMNGAGELYLGYRFKSLEVYEYSAGDSNDILVELYFMESSDDAFGLLSLDWEGEPVALAGSAGIQDIPDDVVPSSRAIYGQGLMRIWTDKIYARILAVLETPESKDAVYTLSRAVFEGEKKPSSPEILKVIPIDIDINWKIQEKRTAFFRSYLVLNSLYYLSHQNILNLGLSVDGVTTSYVTDQDEGKKRVRLIFIKYEKSDAAHEGLSRFLESYVPEEKIKTGAEDSDSISSTIQLEDGWMGYRLKGSSLTLVFESPEREFVNKIFARTGAN